MDWQDQLITLYLFICKHYQNNLGYYCERMSHHTDLRFSDEESIVMFLFGVIKQHKTLKSIYQYAHDHLQSSFPQTRKIERQFKGETKKSPLVSNLFRKYTCYFV